MLILTIWRRPGMMLSTLLRRWLSLSATDDTVWAYLCSDAQRQQIRERGDCPDALARIYADVINRALADKPADLTVGLHVQCATSAQPGSPKVAMNRLRRSCSAASTSMPFPGVRQRSFRRLCAAAFYSPWSPAGGVGTGYHQKWRTGKPGGR